MRLRFTAFILLCIAGAPAHSTPYAPVKERICDDCALPRTGFTLPRHAVVVGSWGFFSFGSNFQVLDLDSGKLVHAFVPSPTVPTQRAPRPTRSAHRLPPAAMPQLLELANRLWAEPHPIRSRDATDTAWDLWLIDGKQVRHESGAGLPAGLAAEWIRQLNKLQGINDPALDEPVRGK